MSLEAPEGVQQSGRAPGAGPGEQGRRDPCTGAGSGDAAIPRAAEQVSRTKRGRWPANVTGGSLAASLGGGEWFLLRRGTVD